MPNSEHVKILKLGADAWNRWRAETPGLHPNLTDGDLCETDLRGAILRDLNLCGVKFHNAILRGADLTGAYLVETSFKFTDLSGTMFANSTMGDTSFVNVDLSMAKDLDLVKHKSSSYVAVDTIILSHGKIPESFLQGAGVPLLLRARATELLNAMTRGSFYSCFISYSRADLTFAQRLHERFQSRGIRCWRDDSQLLPGDTIDEALRQGVKQWDQGNRISRQG